jgi:ATP-dependent DNA ligase
MFVKVPRPRAELPATKETVLEMLGKGWAVQPKWDGVKVQIEIYQGGVAYYNKSGQPLTKKVSDGVTADCHHLFNTGTVLEGELLKDGKVVIFDIVKEDSMVLWNCTFEQRFERLVDLFSGHRTGELLICPTYWDTLLGRKLAVKILEDHESDDTEGLVYRSPSKGFPESGIIRSRRKGRRFESKIKP